MKREVRGSFASSQAGELEREGAWYRQRDLAKLWMTYGDANLALDHLERAVAAVRPHPLLTIGIDPI